MIKIDKLINEPLKLNHNRVSRSYKGGMLIGEWQGIVEPKDNNKPEEWVASMVEARNSIYIPDEGLSKIDIKGQEIKLIDLILSAPGFYLGQNHIEKYGINMAVLTKVLDASVRLSIQVHPTKAFAKTHFKSNYGKTEAWYILGGREVAGELPYVLVGFKPGVTRQMWKGYFEEQDIDSMINALHKFYVQPGDVMLIKGGLPHAIGSGCFLIEIQEPTDYTMRVEQTAFDRSTLPDKLCHQGLGFELMLDCFTYDSMPKEEVYNQCFKKPLLLNKTDEDTIECLIGEVDTPCFSMNRLKILKAISVDDDSFKTCIVVSSYGYIETSFCKIELKQGDSYFLPANLGKITFINIGEAELEVILCYPPK